jgi:hypothetical protein
MYKLTPTANGWVEQKLHSFRRRANLKQHRNDNRLHGVIINWPETLGRDSVY